jgi:hypothetical protein
MAADQIFLSVLDTWSFQDWQAFNRAYGMPCPLGKLARMCCQGFLGVKESQIWWKDKEVLGPAELGKHLRAVEEAQVEGARGV